MRGVSVVVVVVLLVLATAAKAAVAPPACTPQDRAIYVTEGATFPVRFRELAGLTVSEAAYTQAVADEAGLSLPCAACYGKAYTCGWAHCKWACRSAGAGCDACLKRNGCIGDCILCTGF